MSKCLHGKTPTGHEIQVWIQLEFDISGSVEKYNQIFRFGLRKAVREVFTNYLTTFMQIFKEIEITTRGAEKF